VFGNNKDTQLLLSSLRILGPLFEIRAGKEGNDHSFSDDYCRHCTETNIAREMLRNGGIKFSVRRMNLC
jgi:hypothetical protein